MKKLLTFALALSATLLTLVSCSEITDSGWIKNTRWKADLSVYDVYDTGEAIISFTMNGYRFKLNASKEDRPDNPGYIKSYSEATYIGEVFYEYPTVKIPYLQKDKEGNEVTYYWIGTVSEDGRQMVIDKFDGLMQPGSVIEDLHDIVFTR
ncbi:MAG: hypothetical protein J5495_06050 [Bacteroidales bacterium]|nr:hypothetical protein [Bacteroidales bacterium]